MLSLERAVATPPPLHLLPHRPTPFALHPSAYQIFPLLVASHTTTLPPYSNGAKDFLNTEYMWLAAFVAIVAVSLIFLLMNVDYSKSCDQSGDDKKKEMDAANKYTPYMYGALCDNFAWKRYLAGLWTAICFVVGAVFSAAAGYAGMFIATKANTRTAIASNDKKTGFQDGLAVAFGSGAVMSFSVIALGLTGVSLLYCIFAHVSRDHVWDYVSGFGAGGSAIALFARVGGGIYTKAADCGADLVGKVEAGFDEDSPHNPAVIADNIGDNVGDVAGMGADLFESYVGSIIAAAAIGNNVGELQKMQPFVTAGGYSHWDNMSDGQKQSWRNNAQALPFWIAGCGVFASVIGVIFTQAWSCLLTEVEEIDEWMPKTVGTYDVDTNTWKKGNEDHHMKNETGKSFTVKFWADETTGTPFYAAADAQPAQNDKVFLAAKNRAYGEYKMHAEESLGEGLLWSLRIGVAVASVISICLSLVCCILLFGALDWFLAFRIWFCIIIGLVAGITIGTWTEYCTAFYSPVISISKQGLMSPATVIIQGLGVGMISCVVPCLAIVVAIILCDKCASFYGISIAAVGMLSTLGVTLATDAYGPVADNAGGLAEMCSELSLGELLAKMADVAAKLEAAAPTVSAEARALLVTRTLQFPEGFGSQIGSGFPNITTAVEGEGDIVAAIVADIKAIGAYGAGDASSGDVEKALGPIENMLTIVAAGELGESLEKLLQPEINGTVRDVTDALDALGNTTAATGKGFAIGSAVLTASGLIAAYINGAEIGVINLGSPIVVAGLLLGAMLPFLFAALTMLSVGRAAEMIILQVRLQLYEIMAVAAKPNGVTTDARWSKEYATRSLKKYTDNTEAYNAKYDAVRAAYEISPDTPQGDVERWEATLKVWRFDGRASEVLEILNLNDQFLDDMYVYWATEAEAAGRVGGAYFSECTKIATTSSLSEMVTPGALAILSPPIVGFLMGRLALAGLLIGALSSGFMLAITMSNAGGAWDNAKKYVEKGNFGGKYLKDEFGEVLYVVAESGIKKKAKNPVHDANVIGDTVGDPFKDTSGPSLNILIKLMSVMALVLAPRFAQIADDEGFKWNDQYGGAWWIAIILMVILAAIILGSNLLITKITGTFKAKLEDKKKALQNVKEGVNADAPAMSPARKKKEAKAAAPVEVEMTEPAKEAVAAPAAEEVAAPAAAPAEEEEAAAAAPAEEVDAAAE